MKNTFWNKKIPTLLGMFLLMIGIIATSYLTQNSVIFTSRASAGNTPENIRITNIFANSFTVSYTTSQKIAGVIAYGTEKSLGQTALDDRAVQLENLTPFQVHYLTVKNLMPGTKYYFSVTSGTDTFLNNGELFEAITAPQLTNDTQAKSLTGKLTTSQGTPPQEAIVYIKTSDSQTLSTLVKSSGAYTAGLNTMRDSSLTSYISFSDDTKLQLLIVSNNSQSNATVLYKNVENVAPIIISQDYDFTTTSVTIASSSAQIGFPSFTASSSGSLEPKIITPKKDEAFKDSRPIFKGTTQPNTNVTITIHSDPIEATITSDSRGNWSFRPSAQLAPGSHTITIISKDKFGISKTISQLFTVYASGSQVEQTATPSATTVVTPTIKPTSTPVPTNTPTPTKKPTITPTPIQSGPTGTVTPTMAPSATPTVTTVSLAPTVTTTITNPTSAPTITTNKGGGSAVASPGSNAIPMGIGAVLTTLGGVVLFFFSNSSL